MSHFFTSQKMNRFKDSKKWKTPAACEGGKYLLECIYYTYNYLMVKYFQYLLALFLNLQ